MSSEDEGLVPPSVMEWLGARPWTPAPVSAAGLEAWPVLIHSGHGENTTLLGVYADREAAFRALKAEPNMTAYVDERGHLRGRPARETPRLGFGKWAHGWPVKVEG